MRILKDFNIPDFKFPKFKMKGLSNIEELKVDYESLEKEAKNKGNKKIKNYEITDYKTVKEIFERSTTEYADNVFILEKSIKNSFSKFILNFTVSLRS